MPLQKTSNDDLVRVHLPAPGEWVDVKARLGRDDERARIARMLQGQKVRAGEAITEFDFGALYDFAVFATMEVAIKRWSFKDPLTPSNLRALDDDSVNAITAWFEEHYEQPRTEAAAKNSEGAGLTPFSTKAQSRPSSTG